MEYQVCYAGHELTLHLKLTDSDLPSFIQKLRLDLHANKTILFLVLLYFNKFYFNKNYFNKSCVFLDSMHKDWIQGFVHDNQKVLPTEIYVWSLP